MGSWFCRGSLQALCQTQKSLVITWMITCGVSNALSGQERSRLQCEVVQQAGDQQAGDQQAGDQQAGDQQAARLARIAPLSPADAERSFRIRDGFSLQQVASEPLVTDPVAAAFDEDGRLYVVEMNDYPYTDKSTDKPGVERTSDLPIGKVRLLEDTDDDGHFDKSTIFAHDLSWPTGIAVHRGGVFVAATPDIWYLKDEDGDGMADVRTRLFSGFRKLNVQAVANNLIRGLDHRIYGAGGTNGGTIASVMSESAPPIVMSRGDFCFSPDVLHGDPQFEMLSGGARFGNTFDDWGNRFICNIRNPIQHVVLPRRYLNRNPALASGSPLHDVAAAGDQIPVYRSSPPEPWRVVNAARLTSQGDPRMPRSEKNAQGFMTSACGVTVYRGDAYPREFREQVFLAEVAGNLIHRQHLQASGVTFTSQRIDPQSEFVSSTDNWFRPVNFVHAPDGTLYVLDMYRETIEHPWSMPDDLKAMLDLENGRDRGRIYRLAPPGFQRRSTPQLSRATNEELVDLLKHANAWHRDTAHRLLFERRAVDMEDSLRALLQDTASEAPGSDDPDDPGSDVGRLHALWTLEGFGLLEESDLKRSLRDSSAGVREHAVLLAERRMAMNRSLDLVSILQEMADDLSPRVRMQVAFTLGQFPDPQSRQALERIARKDAADSWIALAVLSAPRKQLDGLLQTLLQDRAFAEQIANQPLLRQLAIITGVQKDQLAVQQTVELIQQWPDEMRTGPIAASLLIALDEGLRRTGGSLPGLLGDSPLLAVLQSQFLNAAEVVSNADASLESRLAAFRLLSLGKETDLVAVLSPLLSNQQPPDVQIAAVRTLAGLRNPVTTELFLSSFAGSTPAVQYELIEGLSAHPAGVSALLTAIDTAQIPAAQVTPIRRTLLMSHADPDLREKAKALLAADRETSRSRVLASFQESLQLQGDTSRGRTVFQRECASCHRMDGTGHDVGPSLITVQHRTASELLTQILDPNREVGPAWLQFAVALTDGQVLAGMIAEESASSLTLRKAENREDVLLRENIDDIKATGLSLMPEGFEKKISVQEMADLIAFLRNGGPEALR